MLTITLHKATVIFTLGTTGCAMAVYLAAWCILRRLRRAEEEAAGFHRACHMASER